MTELTQISLALIAAEASGEPAWLATVVRIDGSAYRRPGARLLFSREGALAGSISGGCLEREVMRTGSWLASQGPVCRSYDARPDQDGHDGLRTGCNGKIEIMIEPVTPSLAELLQSAAREVAGERRVALATVIGASSNGVQLGQRAWRSSAGDGSTPGSAPCELTRGVSQALSSQQRSSSYLRCSSFEALLEIVEPAPHLFLLGAGVDAVPVARFASLLGWSVSVCSTTSHFAIRDRFARVAPLSTAPLEVSIAALERCARPLGVVMAHDYSCDRAALGALLDSSVAYIAMLGPARRTERMLRELQDERGAYPRERLACVHGPAGLHLGAETAEEIALSIVAEAQAVLASGEGGFLRDRGVGIHDKATQLRLLRAQRA